jgi:hypothetical protein
MRLRANIIAIEPVLFVDIGMNHPDVAAIALDKSLEQRGVLVPDITATAPAVPVESGLNGSGANWR